MPFVGFRQVQVILYLGQVDRAPCGVLAFSEGVVSPISMVSLTEGVTFSTLSPAGSCPMESRSTMELPCSFKTNPSLGW